MSISFKIKVLLQDLKKCKHWFSYCSKIILNDYTKEICAKQVANQSDFLKAFLHLEPLLRGRLSHPTPLINTSKDCHIFHANIVKRCQIYTASKVKHHLNIFLEKNIEAFQT